LGFAFLVWPKKSEAMNDGQSSAGNPKNNALPPVDNSPQSGEKNHSMPAQSTSGSQSPNISGSGNTVIYNNNAMDPQLKALLDEFIKKQDSLTPEKLRPKYPLGYLIL
jgi:hypothetical protein